MISNKLFAFLFCFLYLEQVADGIWPVIKLDCMEAPTITSKLRLYVKRFYVFPGKQGNTVHVRTLQADMVSGLFEGGMMYSWKHR